MLERALGGETTLIVQEVPELFANLYDNLHSLRSG